MGGSEADARVEALTREISSLAGEFAERAGPLLREALERGLQRLVVERAEWFNHLPDDGVAALRTTAREAIERAVKGVQGRLTNSDIWLHPTIEVGSHPAGNLDNLNHRAWVAVLNAAAFLDPVLLEFGLKPSDVPDFGGGHYGLQPQRLSELDPRHSLERLWNRYVTLYERRCDALRRLPEERLAREREAARRRWFGGG